MNETILQVSEQKKDAENLVLNKTPMIIVSTKTAKDSEIIIYHICWSIKLGKTNHKYGNVAKLAKNPVISNLEIPASFSLTIRRKYKIITNVSMTMVNAKHFKNNNS